MTAIVPVEALVKVCVTVAKVPPVKVNVSLVVWVPPSKVIAFEKLPFEKSIVSESLPASVLTLMAEPVTDANGTSTFPSTDVIAGNVATRLGAQDLVRAGADAIKVGVGPGGVCTTRLVAGVGVPQLTAIADCSGLDVPVIADGGIRTSGDIAKALAAGAQSVMIGSMFAGTKESPGEVEQSPHGLVKRVRGMASFEALERRAQREGTEVDAEYFEQRAPEGVEGTVIYKGSIGPLVGKLLAGVRSSMSYLDAESIAEFQANAQFIRITNAGLTESHPHATHLR